jgi:NADPH2:quinone reductase
MKAVTLVALGTPPAVHDAVPAPTPAANEVLVRVHASSVNPVDNAISAGMLDGMVEHEFPVVLGRDYAGVVEQVGADVTRYAVGDEVYGFLRHANPTVHDGTWAELITVPEDMSIARKPAGVDLATAGAAPLAAITATAAVDALQLSEGDTVLVVGATGGVGSLAVQLAAHAGAVVIAPGLPEDEEYLRGLGVAEVLPRDGDVAAAVREHHPDGVDALLDVVSYAPGAFDAALKNGARVASPNGAAGEAPGRTNVMADPSPENLERVAQLLEAGTLTVPIQDTYDLDRAGDGLAALGATHIQGKLAIRIA